LPCIDKILIKETIHTIFGPVECLKVKPVTVIGHFFQSSDAMTIWFTNSKDLIPVKFLLNFKLGTLKGNMTGYIGPDMKYVIN